MLLVWSFSSISRIFHSLRDVTITDEVLPILTYTWQSWPYSSEHLLTCNTYCDTSQHYIMAISENPWHEYLLPSVWQWSFKYLFQWLRSVPTGNRASITLVPDERSTTTPPQRPDLYSLLIQSKDSMYRHL